MATSLGLVLLASLAFGQPGARTQNEDESDGFGGVLVATPGALPSGLPQVQLVLVAEGLADPVDIAAANDGSDRLFIVERYGQIRVVDASGALLETPFLDLSAQVQSGYMEQGLLGLAFHPDYRGNGRFFVAYTDRRTNGDTFVMEFQVSPDDANIADPKSGRLLLAVDQPFVEHNGGTLRFGPDGYLYIGMGDGGFSGDPYDHAQDRGSLLGKLLRIDVDTPVPAPYAIPTDNPLAGPGRNDNPFLPIATPADARGERREGRKPRGQNPQAVLSESGVIERPRPEIWALGFRNPWQFSFDPDSGDLYIPDVGQKTWEEINVEPAGSIGGLNYGWDWLEGSHCYPEEIARCPRQQIGTLPVAEYAHGEDNCAIVGIGVYRGDASPSLDGIYFNTDFCSGTIWGLQRGENGSWVYEALLHTGLRPNGAGQDMAGELYVAAAGDPLGPYVDPYAHPTGTIWRLVAAKDVPEGATVAPLDGAQRDATPAAGPAVDATPAP